MFEEVEGGLMNGVGGGQRRLTVCERPAKFICCVQDGVQANARFQIITGVFLDGLGCQLPVAPETLRAYAEQVSRLFFAGRAYALKCVQEQLVCASISPA